MLSALTGLALLTLAGSAAADSQIPDMLLHLEPGPDGKAYALVVEKLSQQLLVYTFDGSFRQVAQMSCSTGKMPGDKAVSGDGRTPEGVYFFTHFFPDRELAPLYGTGAYPLDYPNLLDRIQGRNGHSIWLHGTNKPFKSFDSNGCIALQNHDLDQVGSYIAMNRTPILIAERLNFVPAQSLQPAVSAVKGFLERWKRALETGTYQEYLNLFDSEYLPDIDWWRQWNKQRRTVASSSGELRLELAYLTIARDREHFVALFDQQLRLGERRVPAGPRKLFLRSSGEGLRIDGEESPGAAAGDSPATAQHPLLAALQSANNPPEPAAVKPATTTTARRGQRAASPPLPPAPATAGVLSERVAASGTAEISQFVEQWIKAWSTKNLKLFGECYAEDFYANGMDRQAFLEQKEQLNQRNERIRVSYSNLVIRQQGPSASVSFLQQYESSSYRAVGTKRLSLKQENGKWKIYRESWSKAAS